LPRYDKSISRLFSRDAKTVSRPFSRDDKTISRPFSRYAKTIQHPYLLPFVYEGADTAAFQSSSAIARV
jgi:hypothetical protein